MLAMGVGDVLVMFWQEIVTASCSHPKNLSGAKLFWWNKLQDIPIVTVSLFINTHSNADL